MNNRSKLFEEEKIMPNGSHPIQTRMNKIPEVNIPNENGTFKTGIPLLNENYMDQVRQ